MKIAVAATKSYIKGVQWTNKMVAQHIFALLTSFLAVAPSSAFVSPTAPLTQFKSVSSSLNHHYRRPLSSTSSSLRMNSDGDERSDEEGADLAAQFFQAMKDRNMSFEEDEVEYADEEDDEFDGGPSDPSSASVSSGGGDLDDSDDAILREYDVSMTGEGASLTNEQIYDEMKDRVFESAGAFVELTKGVNEDGDYDDSASSMVYNPPQKVPDSGLTAGEVVELVLLALRNNDNPSIDRGVEIFFGYSSPESQIVEQIETEMLTPSEYRNFLSMSEDNMALFTHQAAVIDKADFSPDRLKGYFTARLLMNADGTSSVDDVSVNFILSTTGTNDDDCWLIDSMLIRPSKLRRRRRR